MCRLKAAVGRAWHARRSRSCRHQPGDYDPGRAHDERRHVLMASERVTHVSHQRANPTQASGGCRHPPPSPGTSSASRGSGAGAGSSRAGRQARRRTRPHGRVGGMDCSNTSAARRKHSRAWPVIGHRSAVATAQDDLRLAANRPQRRPPSSRRSSRPVPVVSAPMRSGRPSGAPDAEWPGGYSRGNATRLRLILVPTL